MEKFNPSELCADIKIYDYKKKVKYDEKSLVIFEKTGLPRYRHNICFNIFSAQV